MLVAVDELTLVAGSRVVVVAFAVAVVVAVVVAVAGEDGRCCWVVDDVERE